MRFLIILGVLGCAAPERPKAKPGGVTPETVAARALTALDSSDFAEFAAVVHPERGVRFSPYPHVDTVRDRVLLREALVEEASSPQRSVWGNFDGSGDTIRFTFPEYVARFVRDADFARAPRVVRDSAPIGTGNALHNMRQVYPNATIIEYHIPGRDPRYNGMDWRSLWLVLEKRDESWYLIGVIHGEWTI